MTLRSGHGFAAPYRWLLCMASLLVPAGLRADWLREWQAEFWYVCRANRGGPFGHRRIEFCLGAFPDALFHRLEDLRQTGQSVRSGLTPSQCVIALAALLVVALSAWRTVPSLRDAGETAQLHPLSHLVLIEDPKFASHSQETIPFGKYITWTHSRQRYFDDLAFYRIETESGVAQGAGSPLAGEKRSDSLQVAIASSNLFTMLGIPVRFNVSGTIDDQPLVILSDSLWRRDFAASPDITGSQLLISGHLFRIAGVAPHGAWQLPGAPDLWLLSSHPELAAGSLVSIVGHLNRSGRVEMWASTARILTSGQDGEEEVLRGIALDQLGFNPWAIYSFSALLALLTLPTLISVSMSEYGTHSHRPPLFRRLHHLVFFAAKIAILLPAAYYASLDIAWCNPAIPASTSECLQFIANFVICLFGFRWAVADQRQRCPVCLHCVAHPANVGVPGCTFLGWNGTELMCTGGHTLLHVPALPTSWFSTQRWIYLDTSWKVLFPGTNVAT
jgi:hypothetical protein